MRVLIDYRPALRERSGAGEYTHQLVRALAARYGGGLGAPLELAIFSSSWKDRITDVRELGAVSAIDRRVPVSVLNFAWHRFGWPPVEMLVNDGRAYDVTHSSHPLILPSRRAAKVVTIHDLYFLKHPERTRAEIRRDYPSLTRTHAQRADRILVSSKFAVGEVERELGVPRDRIVVCPAGAPDWPPRASPPANGYILFVGTLEPRKNIGGLLDAYELLLDDARLKPSRSENTDGARTPGTDGARKLQPDVPTLVLAGRATGESRAWLDRIGRAPLDGLVRHLGYVPSEGMRPLYAGARLLVLPSFEEGFGMTALEAMTAGVPVVAARRGSLPEVIGDAGVLVDPEQPREIAAAISRIVNDERFAADCAARGIERAKAFRWDVTAERVYDAYRQAVEHHAHRR